MLRRTLTRRIRRVAELLALAGVVSMVALLPSGPAAAENSGFWYGADSGGPGPSNGSAPYHEPSCGSGHAYGGYLGKIGGADLVSSANSTGYGPGHTFAWVAQYAADANADHFGAGADGVGAGGYWFALGPNDTAGTGLSAYNWGYRQGTWAVDDWQRWYDHGIHRMPLQIVWMDVEGPGSNGWGSDHNANRQVFNGFWDAVATNKDLQPGVYSTAVQWNSIMSGNTSIPNTWEWTAQTSRENAPAPCPTSFSSSSTSAVFFGGQTAGSAKAALWQWSIGNADYDQIDSNKALPD
jgi:hypothetical protein